MSVRLRSCALLEAVRTSPSLSQTRQAAPNLAQLVSSAGAMALAKLSKSTLIIFRVERPTRSASQVRCASTLAACPWTSDPTLTAAAPKRGSVSLGLGVSEISARTSKLAPSPRGAAPVKTAPSTAVATVEHADP